MSSVFQQKLISIKQATKVIPTRPHKSTIFRWIERGCRGKKLESWTIGGQRFTSVEALETFFSATNNRSPEASLPSKSRQSAIESAELELKEFGL